MGDYGSSVLAALGILVLGAFVSVCAVAILRRRKVHRKRKSRRHKIDITLKSAPAAVERSSIEV